MSRSIGSKNKIKKLICKYEHNIAEVGRTQSGTCRKCLSFYDQKVYEKNRKRIKLQHKKYYQENKNKINIYEKQKRLSDLNYKLSRYLRSRLNSALKNNQKLGSAVYDLGCTIVHLKNYLEDQFKSGMSWKNRGNGPHKWNIDHIKPLSNFNLEQRKQFLKAVHFTNLQPLWFKDNLCKEYKSKRSTKGHGSSGR